MKLNGKMLCSFNSTLCGMASGFYVSMWTFGADSPWPGYSSPPCSFCSSRVHSEASWANGIHGSLTGCPQLEEITKQYIGMYDVQCYINLHSIKVKADDQSSNQSAFVLHFTTTQRRPKCFTQRSLKPLLISHHKRSYCTWF